MRPAVVVSNDAAKVRSVAVRRIRQRVGGLPAPVLAELDRALRLHLAL